MSPGLARRPGSLRWALVLAGLCVAATVLIGHWALGIWYWQPDEIEFRQPAEWFPGHLPHSLWALDPYRRGIQRLTIWILGGSLSSFGSIDGFRVARWIQVSAFASTMVPVWIWARAAGASRPWATAGALLSIAVPWAVLSATFLTEPIAYPLVTWACFAIWKAAVFPGARADLIALASIVVATLARTSFLALGLTFMLACIGQELRLADRGMGGLRAAVRVFPRRHPALCACILAALLIGAVGAGAQLTGVYGRSALSIHVDRLWGSLTYLLRIGGAGTAFVPLIVALGFAGSQLARPADPKRLGLAMVLLAFLVTLVLTAAVGNLEERYIFFLASVSAVAVAVAGTRKDVALWAIAVAAAGVLVAVLLSEWRSELGPAGFLLFPAETFHARVVRLGLHSHLPSLLKGGLDPFTVALVVVAAAAAALLAGAARVRNAGVDAALRWGIMGSVLAIGVGQASYALDKFSAAVPDPGLKVRAWADTAAAGESFGVWLPPLGRSANVRPIWQEERYFNLGAREDIIWGSPLRTSFYGEPRVQVRVDPASGALRPLGRGSIPRLLLVPQLAQPAALRGRIVATDQHLPVLMVRLSGPPSVQWVLSGADPDGWLQAGRTARLRVFAAPRWPASGVACVRLIVAAPPDQASPRPGSAVAGGHKRRFTVAAGHSWTATIRVPYAERHGDVRFRVHASRLFPDGRRVAAQFTIAELKPCGS